jgi:hypothetical protein
MRILELSEATAPLAEYARGVDEEAIVITVGGKPVAVLEALENLDSEIASLSANPRFLAIIERARARQKAEGGISPDEMRRRLGLERPAGKKRERSR